MIDKKSKIFFVILFSLFMVSIVFTYNKYVLNKNFKVFTDEKVFNEALPIGE